MDPRTFAFAADWFRGGSSRKAARNCRVWISASIYMQYTRTNTRLDLPDPESNSLMAELSRISHHITSTILSATTRSRRRLSKLSEPMVLDPAALLCSMVRKMCI